MDRVAQYLERAKEAEAKAEAASYPSLKERYHGIAEQWRQLARQAQGAR
jgi:hypothetical protein